MPLNLVTDLTDLTLWKKTFVIPEKSYPVRILFLVHTGIIQFCHVTTMGLLCSRLHSELTKFEAP